MKRFVFNSIVFLLLFIGLSYFLEFSKLYTKLLPNKNVYEAIRISRQKNDGIKILLMGDSVSRQLFHSLKGHQDITSVACNQAIDIIGQYFLMHNFITTNPGVEKVYLVYNPFSFNNNLDHIFTFNYFLKPFYNSEYKKLFTTSALIQVRKIPFYRLANFAPIKICFWTPTYQVEKDDHKFLSDISIQYIIKMQKLAEAHQITFSIIPVPIKASRKDELKVLKKHYFSSEDRLDIFDKYFANLIILPDSLYRDHIHFNEQGISDVRALMFEDFFQEQPERKFSKLDTLMLDIHANMN